MNYTGKIYDPARIPQDIEFLKKDLEFWAGVKQFSSFQHLVRHSQAMKETKFVNSASQPKATARPSLKDVAARSLPKFDADEEIPF